MRELYAQVQRDTGGTPKLPFTSSHCIFSIYFGLSIRSSRIAAMERRKLQKGRGRRGKEQHADKCIFIEDKEYLLGSLTVGRNATDYRLPGREMERAVRVCKHFKCIPKVGPTMIMLLLSNLLLTPHHVMVVVFSHNHTQKSGFFPVSSLIPPFCS